MFGALGDLGAVISLVFLVSFGTLPSLLAFSFLMGLEFLDNWAMLYTGFSFLVFLFCRPSGVFSGLALFDF